MTGVADGGVALAHGRAQPPCDLSIFIDDAYYGPATTGPGRPMPGAGLKGVNQIAHAGFAGSQFPWTMDAPEGIGSGLGFSEKWNLARGAAAFVHDRDAQAGRTSVLVYQDPVEGERITVTPGATYDFGAYIGLHRCEAHARLTFFDAEGRVLLEVEARPDAVRRGGAKLSSYSVARAEVVAPAEACWARIEVHTTSRPNEARPDSLMLLARPWFGQTGRKTGDRWRITELSPLAVATMRQLDRSGGVRSVVPLPANLYDGVARRIDVREPDGRSLYGAPVTLELDEPALGEIEAIKGNLVTGWASVPGEPETFLEVRLLIDGRAVTSAKASGRHRRSKGHGFRLSIPVDFMDGLAHRFSIVATRSGRVLAEVADFLPVSQTPFDKIQRFGSSPRAWHAPAARYRYEAMQAALRDAAEAPAEQRAEALDRLAQISRAHDVLMTGFESVHAPFAPLAFPVHDRPKVSVVVPAHNKLGVTYYCLSALLFATNRASFEVIVVDDGSSDETRDIERIVSGIKVVRHESAQGFVDACNDGVAAASGDHVVLLNNDTEPTVGWLDAMLSVFDNFDDVGIVGAKLVYPDGRLQEAGGIVWNTGDPWNYGRGANADDPRYNYVRQVDYLSGAAIMLPRALWDDLGGLSPEYRPAYFEDTDLCFKVKAAGRKVVYTPFSLIYHFEGVTSGVDVGSGMKRFQEINRPKFKARWTELYKDNGDLGVDVELNKDRGVARRALMLDMQFPRGGNDAGSYAALQEARLLQSLGFKVTFLPRNNAYLGGHTERVQKMGIEAVYGPYAQNVESFLQARGGEFDLIYVTRYLVAHELTPLIRQYAPQARLAFCNADLHFLRELREAVLMQSEAMMERSEVTRVAEMAVVSAADVTLSYNAAEHVVMEVVNPGAKVAQAPWVVDVAPEPPPFEARRDLAYLGGFNHPPNRLAVEFFGRDVMPGVREVLPDVLFNVFGSGIKADLRDMSGDGVEIRGYAPDLKAVYDGCRIFVAPLLTGAGLKGKVIDALAFGTPSVLSPIAAEGANLRDGVEALIARTPREWVEAIRKLYGDPKLWTAMSRAAQAHAARFYSFEAGQRHMRDALAIAGLEVEPDARALVTRASYLK